MTWPGAVRFHYGHPDIWSKLFVMTRGGISKATRCAGRSDGRGGTTTACSWRARQHLQRSFALALTPSPPPHNHATHFRAFHISEDVFAGYNHTLRGEAYGGARLPQQHEPRTG